ncbi:MAG: MBL fold metallo-hydrolase [Candidatus Jordarchaeales archaeon]
MAIMTVPEKNKVMFVWFNRYAGVTVRTPSKTLVIDPVDVKPKIFTDVSAILITHEHYDHLDPRVISEIHKLSDCLIIADLTSARRLRNMVKSEKLIEAQVGLEIKIDNVAIRAEKCNHPPATSPVTYIITSDDGVKIFHTADSLPFPEMAKIGERERFDLVFCTVGIAPGASPETGFEIARLTKPRIAVPYHTSSTADLRRFSELVKSVPGVNCLIPEIGKVYQVTRGAS